MHIGNCALFTLEVSPHGGTTRAPNHYISKRSPEERASCHGGEFLRFARREVADEAGGTARGVLPENPRAHHQPPRPRALRLLYLFRRETRAGARCGRAFLFEKFAFETAYQAIPKIMRA